MRIPKNLHYDPNFRALTSAAQWLYFSRKMSGQKARFDLSETLTWAADLDADKVLEAADELRNSPFAHVLNKRTTRRKKISLDLRREVYASNNWACAYCGSNQDLEIDHIVPLSRGGTEDRSNLQTLCASCNKKKGTKIHALVQS